MTFWSDLRLAARLLVKETRFTLPAIVALALGIAANTTVFTIVNAAFLRDLPFHEPDRVVVLGTRNTATGRTSNNISWPEFEEWRTAARTFDGLAAFAERPMNLADDTGPADRVTGTYVSANAFELLGHRPILGRGFVADDDRTGAVPVVVLSHAFWESRYRGATEILGRTIRVNGVPSLVVGVMPAGFAFPENSQVWRAMSQLPAEFRNTRAPRTISGFGRLGPGVSIDAALADLAVTSATVARDHPDTNANVAPLVQPFRERNITRPLRVVLSLLTGAVVFVLLIGCANVANLLLARAASREREVSLRMSLGAGRWMIVRQLLIESALLAMVAGIGGLSLSVFGVRAFALAVGDQIPYWLQFSIDARVFAFVATVSLGTSVLFGLLPAVYTSRTSIIEVLNEARLGSSGTRGTRWTASLVTGQLALTLMLLTGAGLMIRSVAAHFQIDAGVRTANLVQLRLTLSGARYVTTEQRNDFYRRLTTGLSAASFPATIASAGPRAGAAGIELAIEGQSSPASGTTPPVSNLLIGPAYFDTLGTRLLRGREFTAADGGPDRAVVIINERLASIHFQNEDPIGRRIRAASRDANQPPAEWATIVGIAPNVRQRGSEEGSFDPIVYAPYASNPIAGATILSRSERGVAAAAAAIRTQIGALDPDLPLFEVMSVDDWIARDVWEREVFGAMFGLFAVIALALAAVGLYGITAYSVSQRTREIGIRVALGAQVRQVYWLVTRRASLPIGIGLALGLIGSVGVGVAMRALQSEIGAVDPATFVAVVALLVLVALVACLLPAHSATRLDPAAALRSE